MVPVTELFIFSSLAIVEMCNSFAGPQWKAFCVIKLESWDQAKWRREHEVNIHHTRRSRSHQEQQQHDFKEAT